MIGCELLSDIDQICSQPGDGEDLNPLRSHLYVKAWRYLTVLLSLGEQVNEFFYFTKKMIMQVKDRPLENEGNKKYMVVERGKPLENEHWGLEFGEQYIEKAGKFKYLFVVITDLNSIQIKWLVDCG